MYMFGAGSIVWKINVCFFKPFESMVVFFHKYVAILCLKKAQWGWRNLIDPKIALIAVHHPRSNICPFLEHFDKIGTPSNQICSIWGFSTNLSLIQASV